LTARRVEVRHSKGRAPVTFPSDLRNIDLEKQVTMLSNEIASLKELAARRGKDVYGEVGDTVSGYYGDLSNAVISILPSLGKRSRMVGATTSSHPAAVAAVGLLVIGLVASLFLTHRLSREPNKTEPVVRKRTRSRAASQGAASKRTAKAGNAPTGGKKRVDGPMKDVAEPKADQPRRPPDSGSGTHRAE
jgi:hypothetical protein